MYNYSVNFVGGEFKFELGERMIKIERYGVEVFLVNVIEKRGELLMDIMVEVLGRGVGEDGDGKSFVDGIGCVLC